MTRLENVNWWEASAAIFVFVLGGYLVWSGWGFGLGQLNRIGPGFFPIVVGVMLMGLAVAILVQFWRSQAAPPDLPWRPILSIAAGLILFGLLAVTAGLVLATFVLVLVSAMGDRTMSLPRAAITAVAVSALGYVVFILLFRLPLTPFWW